MRRNTASVPDPSSPTLDLLRTLLLLLGCSLAVARLPAAAEAQQASYGTDPPPLVDPRERLPDLPYGYEPSISPPDGGGEMFDPFRGESSPRAAARRAAGGRSPIFVTRGPAFDAEVFEQEIERRLDGRVLGYAYAISLNRNLFGNGGAGGFARNSNDTFLLQSPTKRMNIASISKTITAVAVLQLLEELDLSIYSEIWPYLPASWPLGPNVRDVTFRDLLAHESGFMSQNSDFWNTLGWLGLKVMVAAGANPNPIPASDDDFNYLNANYALLRYIIPEMWRQSPSDPGIVLTDPASLALWYGVYVREHIFEPIGIRNALCFDPAPDETLFYALASPNQAGVPGGDWTMICGSGGWVLSAVDLLSFMVNITYNDDVLSEELRELMEDRRLGLYDLDGRYGTYFSHGGGIVFSATAPGPALSTCIMRFSIEVEASLVVNSDHANGTSACTILQRAFDDAWVE